MQFVKLDDHNPTCIYDGYRGISYIIIAHITISFQSQDYVQLCTIRNDMSPFAVRMQTFDSTGTSHETLAIRMLISFRADAGL